MFTKKLLLKVKERRKPFVSYFSNYRYIVDIEIEVRNAILSLQRIKGALAEKRTKSGQFNLRHSVFTKCSKS